MARQSLDGSFAEISPQVSPENPNLFGFLKTGVKTHNSCPTYDPSVRGSTGNSVHPTYATKAYTTTLPGARMEIILF
jgi:hypothetical protein